MRLPHFTADLPPVWLAVLMLLSWLLARFLPLVRFDVAPLGPGLIGLGLALIGWSAWWFWRKRTPIEPRQAPRALIVEGPYRVNRNPIYSGLILILAGWALTCGALSALLPLAIFPPLLTKRFVIPEEAALRIAFGDAAKTYIDASRRW